MVINLHESLIATSSEVESWVVEALNKGTINKHVNEGKGWTMHLRPKEVLYGEACIAPFQR